MSRETAARRDRTHRRIQRKQAVEGFHPYRYLLEYCPFLGPVREKPRFEAVLATARELVETFVPKEAALED